MRRLEPLPQNIADEPNYLSDGLSSRSPLTITLSVRRGQDPPFQPRGSHLYENIVSLVSLVGLSTLQHQLRFRIAHVILYCALGRWTSATRTALRPQLLRLRGTIEIRRCDISRVRSPFPSPVISLCDMHTLVMTICLILRCNGRLHRMVLFGAALDICDMPRHLAARIRTTTLCASVVSPSAR